VKGVLGWDTSSTIDGQEFDGIQSLDLVGNAE
jgi:hypothetical protein